MGFWRASFTVVMFAIALLAASHSFAEGVKDVRKKMGSRFEITAVHASEQVAREAVEAAYAEIDRLEALISSWRDTSETSRVNRNAGQAVVVSQEFFNLVRRALKVSALTDGAFDITFAGAGQLWNFKDPRATLPTPAAIEAALVNVGHQFVHLDEQARTIRLERPGMRLGFGAIGKGFAANRAVLLMKQRGISSGVVNAGGDLVAFGRQEDGSDWRVAVADPLSRDQLFAYLPITDQAVVTSGDYESFVEVDGVRYAHILDPRTGHPVRGTRSVTVLCQDAELADALATAVFVMGPTDGLRLVNRLRGIDALIVDEDGVVTASDQLASRLVKPGESP